MGVCVVCAGVWCLELVGERKVAQGEGEVREGRDEFLIQGVMSPRSKIFKNSKMSVEI